MTKNQVDRSSSKTNLSLIAYRQIHWWTYLEFTLQFFLDPLGDMSEGNLPLPECRSHVKV